jgi:ABC-2 type transport system ATP-binding protein
MNTVLSVNGISKNYGSIKALQDVSFDVPTGSVFGILGPNGSGKTTLLGGIMDVLKMTSGSYKLFDEPANESHRKRIGTLLETPNFYQYLSGEVNLKIAAGIKRRGLDDIDRVLKIVNLYQRKTSKFSTYSLGMKQRLAIASCLLGNPEVMVFDEPTNGLDPEGIAEIRALIKTLHAEGKTIVMASHLLDEVEKVCTHVAILKFGKLLATGHVNEILATEDIVEVSATNIEALKDVLGKLNGYNSLQRFENYLHLYYSSGQADLQQLNSFCFENGVVLNHLTVKRKSLEAKFFELTN